jgi:hypothetical protein
VDALDRFDRHIADAIAVIDDCSGADHVALQATTIAHKGVQRALELVGAVGHGYTHHGYVLTGLVLELARFSQRFAGSFDDIDQARAESVRKNLQRARR